MDFEAHDRAVADMVASELDQARADLKEAVALLRETLALAEQAHFFMGPPGTNEVIDKTRAFLAKHTER